MGEYRGREKNARYSVWEDSPGQAGPASVTSDLAQESSCFTFHKVFCASRSKPCSLRAANLDRFGRGDTNPALWLPKILQQLFCRLYAAIFNFCLALRLVPPPTLRPTSTVEAMLQQELRQHSIRIIHQHPRTRNVPSASSVSQKKFKDNFF